MYELAARIFGWLARKVGAIVLIGVVAVVLYALWLAIQDRSGPPVVQASRQVLEVERDRLKLAAAEMDRRIAEFKVEAEQQRQRIEQAEKILQSLRAMESWWDRLFGRADQQKADQEQLARVQRLRQDAADRRQFVEQEAKRSKWEKDGLEISIGRLEREIDGVAGREGGAARYLQRSWASIRTAVILGALAYFFGPTLWAVVLYFGLSRLAESRLPISLGPASGGLPEVGASHVSLDARVAPGEVLRIKEKFLQSSDEGLRRRTRFVFDWSLPFTSAACGLIELVEMENDASAPLRATLSKADDPHLELAAVEVPAGISLVLRPRFLAGVIQPADARLQIRRHWQLFRLQSWISGQFRYFEFVGPCRLIVSGSRGVRAERLSREPGLSGLSRRTNRDATIGFTPGLRYRPVRAETFWSYYRGMNPLFDDLFSGEGLFLVQETARDPGSAARSERFWSGAWSAVLKIFGL